MKSRQLSRWVLIGFFLVAGLNHFINPTFYLPLIPPVLPAGLINTASGVLEILLALGLVFSQTRKWAVFGLITLLVGLCWSHIYFIQIGSCVPDSLCIAHWIAWIRLIIIQPLLVWWVWAVR